MGIIPVSQNRSLKLQKLQPLATVTSWAEPGLHSLLWPAGTHAPFLSKAASQVPV